MLSIESLVATKELVAILADKGVALTATAGSPIQEAMAATKTWQSGITCLAEIDKLPAELYQANEVQINNGVAIDDPHTAYLSIASVNLGRLLASHVAYATTVVLPAVADLHDKLKTVLDLEESCGVRSYKVVQVTGSPLFNIPSIVSEIEKFGTLTPARELPIMLDYKSATDEELVNLLKIGSEAYDNAIDEFVANESIETIRQVYAVVFQGDNSEFKNYDMFRADRTKGQARNFVTFLLANRLTAGGEGTPEVTGLAGMSMNKYTLALRNLLEVSGSALFHALQFQLGQIKSGKLIDKIDGKVVYVNAAVYDRFMTENSGDVETILGAAINGDKKFYLNDLVEGVEKYKQAWTYHVTMSKQNALNSQLIDARRCIFDFASNYIRTCDDEIIKENSDRILENVNKFASTTYIQALANLDVLALNALADTMFNHTDAGALLHGVSEAMIANPDIRKEDALNLSISNFVAGWYASQIDTADLS